MSCDCFYLSQYIIEVLKYYLNNILQLIVKLYGYKHLALYTCVFISTILFVLYSDSNNLSAFIGILYSSYIMLYINIIDTSFKQKYPIVYNILTIVSIIFIVCSYTLFMAYLGKLSLLFEPLMAKIKIVKKY